jgi:excisionase family DNA binding protein
MNKDHNVMRPGLDKPNEISYHNHHEPGTEGEDESAKELDRLLTVQEVCELLKVPKTYVYWLTHKKAIPHIKMQGHLRFRESAIDEWLRSQEVHDASS